MNKRFFEIGDRVKIKNINCSRDNMIGEIQVIYPEGMIDSREIYGVVFSENQSGQFNENEMIKI
jgi:hypothetical protein